MTKLELRNALKIHDWTYCYSDSSSVWERGHNNEMKLKSELKKHNSPFSMGEFYSWVYNFILEDFKETENGKFVRIGSERGTLTRDELITREKFNAIENWLNDQ